VTTHLKPGRPDWANFRLLNDYLLWVVFFKKIPGVARNLSDTFSSWRKLCINADEKIVCGYILGTYFTSSSGRPA
jgi:hypothetical protein